MMMMISANQSSYSLVDVTSIKSTEESLLRTQFMQANQTAKERGGVVLTIHQSCEGGREDQDRQRGHTISPSKPFIQQTGFTERTQNKQNYFVTGDDE